jgi:hypothetical protein
LDLLLYTIFVAVPVGPKVVPIEDVQPIVTGSYEYAIVLPLLVASYPTTTHNPVLLL